MRGIPYLKKIMILAIASLFILMPLTVAEPTLLNHLDIDDYSVSYTLTFTPEDLQFRQIEGYDAVDFDGCDYLSDVGKPQLPTFPLRLALPYGMQADHVTASVTDSVVLPDSYTLFPAQPPRPTNMMDRTIESLEVDASFYDTTEPYPGKTVELLGQSDLAGQGIAELLVFPVQYRPYSQQLVVFTTIEITVEGSGGYEYGDYMPESYTAMDSERVTDRLQDIVANDDAISLHHSPDETPQQTLLPPGGPYDHVIITSSSLASYWQPLVEWHTRRGLRDTVVTTSYIYSNYAGADNQEEIRNFVIDAYTTWGTAYFLIGGEHSDVPFEYRTYYQDSTPSDQYYSDFDDDWVYEVFVGRVTADDETQINRFIDKLLHYEQTPPVYSYPLDVLLIGMDLDSSTHCEDLKGYIDSNYIPSQFNVIKVYDSGSSNHETAVKNALNSGMHLVNHADHGLYNHIGTGSTNHNWGLYSGEIDDLTNDDELSIVTSLSCLSNRMDSDDCIAEHFVIYNDMQAGIAYTGNTRNGWGYVGYPGSLSGALDRLWWEGLFDDNKYHIGETLVYAKDGFSTGSPDADLKRHCEWEFNLLGEPEMPIWTDTPETLTVTHPASFSLESAPFLVHVEDSTGGDVAGALVCLWKGDEVYESDYTDTYGDAEIIISPTTPGEMYVTVTKHNYLPYIESVVGTGEAPYVPYNPSPDDDVTAVLVDETLSWEGGDPQGDPVTYDVYFGDTSPPPQVEWGQTGTNYDPGTLTRNTTYFWKIVAHDDGGHSTEGLEWKFTTITNLHMRIEDTVGVVNQDNLVVHVYGAWDEPIKAYQMYISFDTDVFTFVEANFTGSIADEYDADYSLGNEMQSGLLSVGAIWFTVTIPSGGGLLAKLVFDVVATEPCESPLVLTTYQGGPTVYTDVSGFSIYPELVHGSVTITDVLCGDANGDGVINVSDAVFVINYVFIPGSPVPDPVCVADANGDGTVNVSDAVTLINYVFIPGSPPPVTDCCG